MRYSEFSCEKHKQMYYKKLYEFLDRFIIDDLKILDFGCGQADYVQYLNKKIQKLVLVDKFNQEFLKSKFKQFNFIDYTIHGKFDVITVLLEKAMLVAPVTVPDT